MERGPVDAAVVAFEDVLDHGVGIAKEISLAAVGSCDLLLDAHGLSGGVLFAQSADVPNAHSLVHGSRDDEVLLGVELSAHDVVVVTGENGDARTTLPITDANGFVVRGTEDPRMFMVEEDGAYVVEVAVESEETFARLVVPHLDLVVVTTTD